MEVMGNVWLTGTSKIRKTPAPGTKADSVDFIYHEDFHGFNFWNIMA